MCCMELSICWVALWCFVCVPYPVVLSCFVVMQGVESYCIVLCCIVLKSSRIAFWTQVYCVDCVVCVVCIAWYRVNSSCSLMTSDAYNKLYDVALHCVLLFFLWCVAFNDPAVLLCCDMWGHCMASCRSAWRCVVLSYTVLCCSVWCVWRSMVLYWMVWCGIQFLSDSDIFVLSHCLILA